MSAAVHSARMPRRTPRPQTGRTLGLTADSAESGGAAPPAGVARAQPLAARMRPRTIAEFVGQEHLIGEGGALRRQVERGYLASMILWGPPGGGKPTLRRPLSGATGAHFSTLSA